MHMSQTLCRAFAQSTKIFYYSAYDDVERKTREMVEPAEAKRKLVPDEERKSLSQLYEQEFLQVSQTLHE